jgi:ribosome-associated toxin RatA of RatAB toxin-antitoxin module
MLKKLLISAVIIALTTAVYTETKAPDLDKGELIVTSSNSGKYREATAIGVIDAPSDVVWGMITDFESHPKFIPMQKSSKIVKRDGNSTWVNLIVEVGLAEMKMTNKNVEYVTPDKRTLTWDQEKGPFTVSSGHWIIEPYKKTKTKATYTASLAHPLLPNSLAAKLIKNSFPELFQNLRKRSAEIMKANKKG